LFIMFKNIPDLFENNFKCFYLFENISVCSEEVFY